MISNGLLIHSYSHYNIPFEIANPSKKPAWLDFLRMWLGHVYRRRYLALRKDIICARHVQPPATGVVNPRIR